MLERLEKLLLRSARSRPRRAPSCCEGALDELRFALAHQAGIHINAAHASGAQRAQAERERDRGIHAAADEEEDVAVADALPDLLFHQRDPLARIPVFRAAADVEDEVLENARALRRVDHFGMELHAVEPPRRIFDGRRVAGGRGGQNAEPGGRRSHHIAMRHPDLLVIADALQQLRIAVRQIENGQAELAFIALAHRSAEQLRDQLLPVADAEHRNAGRQNGTFHGRAGIVVNAVRAARDDDAPRVAAVFPEVFRSERLRTKRRVPVLSAQ